MRAVIISTFGEPEVLQVAELPVPAPGAGQVRVRVHAAPVHPADLLTRNGALAAILPEQPHFVLGWDFAGTVDEVGDGVTGLTPGQPVAGLVDWFGSFNGTHAEYVVLDRAALAVLPGDADLTAYAGLPLNGLTAAQALDLLGLTAGQTLLVTGAAGGVGGYAIQLAVRSGLQVFGFAGAADAGFVTGAGATFVPSGTDVAAALGEAGLPDGADGVLDTALLGAPALAAVRDGGVFVNVHGPVAPPAERGVRVDSVAVHSDGAQLAGLVAAGLMLRVGATFPLDQAAEAHARLGKGGTRGSVVLLP